MKTVSRSADLAGPVVFPGKPRRPLRVGLGVAAVAAGLWMLAVGVLLVGARGDALAGVRDLERARAQLDAATVLEEGSLEGVRLAQARFGAARAKLRSPVVTPARVLPVIGRQVRSMDALAGAAVTVLDAGANATKRIQVELRNAKDGGPDQRVAMVRSISVVAAGLADRIRTVDLGPSEALVGPLARARNEMLAELTEVYELSNRAAVGARGIAELLEGPRRYLVLAAHNGEMRAGSGMFLVAGVLGVEDGRLRLGDLRRTADLYLPAGADVGGDLEAVWGWLHPGREWRNLGVSPRFDVTAELAARMWEKAGNAPVDGVIALDVIALRELLAATGPVRVDGKMVAADTVVDEILVDQYRASGAAERRDRLGEIAFAVFGRLDAGSWEIGTLAEGLARAASGRHILAWSARPAAQEAWLAAGIDGAPDADALLPALVNRGGNKLDAFMRIDGRISAEPSGTGTAVEVTMTVRNRAPASVPAYVGGPHPQSGLAAGEYHGILALTVPGAAREIRIDGGDAPAVSGWDAPGHVVGTYLTIGRGQERTVTVRFVLPRDADGLMVLPSARHPGIRWTSDGRDWTDTRKEAVKW